MKKQLFPFALLVALAFYSCKGKGLMPDNWQEMRQRTLMICCCKASMTTLWGSVTARKNFRKDTGNSWCLMPGCLLSSKKRSMAACAGLVSSAVVLIRQSMLPRCICLLCMVTAPKSRFLSPWWKRMASGCCGKRNKKYSTFGSPKVEYFCSDLFLHPHFLYFSEKV